MCQKYMSYPQITFSKQSCQLVMSLLQNSDSIDIDEGTHNHTEGSCNSLNEMSLYIQFVEV